jgi:hypothetical protein
MVSEWEKQILAYCIRVSRGGVQKGMIKMSVFPEDAALSLGGITSVQLIDIISYLARLHKNLQDPIRRRGFNCTIEIGHKIDSLIAQEGYHIESLNTDFPIIHHDGYGNEVQFHFTYEPSLAPAMVFEDVQIVELNHNDDIKTLLNAQDTHLELVMQQKFIQEFDFVDDYTTENDDKNTISQRQTEHNKKSAF